MKLRWEPRARAVNPRTRRICVLLAAVSPLAACAAPNYPTSLQTSPGSAPAQAPPARVAPVAVPAPPPPEDLSSVTAAPAPAPVQSQSLPPVEGDGSPPRQFAQNAPPASTPQPAISPSATSQDAPAQTGVTPPTYAPKSQALREAEERESQPASAPPRREITRTVAGGQVVSATHMYRDYVVSKGDHLDAIARDFRADPGDLADVNHLKSANALRPGQHLKIPVAKAYVVQSGDTLAAVARRFDVSAEELASLNDLPVRDRLRSGDRLALPSNIHNRGPTRTTEVVELTPAAPRYTAPRRVTGQYEPLPQGGIYTPGSSAPPTPPSTTSAYANTAPPAYATAAPPPGRYPAYTHSDPRYAGIVGRPFTESTSLTDTQIAAAGRGRFVWPVRGDTLAKFGAQGVGRRNDGLDLRSPQGSVVRAAAAGEVVYAGNQVPGFGNLVLIKHSDGWVTAYAHLDRASVQMRQTVVQGQEIGAVGTTGGVVEPQLHFEVRYAATPTDKAKPIDPLLVLPE